MFKAKRHQTGHRVPRRPSRGVWARGKLWFIGGGVAGAVALLVVLTSALSGPEPAAGRELAPDMVLATANGEFQLSDQRGKVSLLYFSFPGWPTCALEAPVLARIHSEYKNRGVNVVAINFDPRYSLDEWHSFWNAVGAADVILAQDTDGTTARDYRLVALGTEVIVDRSGLVAFRSDGPAGYERLRSAVEQAL